MFRFFANEFFGAYITDIQIITIVVCLALFTACVFFMKYNRIGRNIRAVASNPELSNVVGIHSDKLFCGRLVSVRHWRRWREF